jgi:hypothetical protein
MLGAKVGSDLYCGGGQFRGSRTNGYALIFDGARIGGALELSRGFNAEGIVQLVGARVEGQLRCSSARFVNSNGIALLADSATFGGAVLLRDSFTAEGMVFLEHTVIGHGLDCSGGHFSNPGSCALDLAGASIKGDANLGLNFTANGEVKLEQANVEGSLICSGARIVIMTTNTPAVSIDSAIIGGRFECAGADLVTFESNGVALSAINTKITSDLFLANDFRAAGEVRLSHASIGGDLECAQGHFFGSNTNSDALTAYSATIANSVHLRSGFESVGFLHFDGATIGHYFSMYDIVSPGKITLDLRDVRVGVLNDRENSWPRPGNLYIDNFVYDEIFTDAPTDLEARKKWLHLQPQDHFLPQPYEQLASVLRKMGQNGGARGVLTEKNWDRHGHDHWYHLSWWWDQFFGLMAGFGFKPSLSLFWIIFFICLGKYLFCSGMQHGLMVNTNPDKEKQPFNAWIFSVETFVPLLKLGIVEHWRPNAVVGNRYACAGIALPQTGFLLSLYFYAHKILGWFITFFFLDGLAGLIKT